MGVGFATLLAFGALGLPSARRSLVHPPKPSALVLGGLLGLALLIPGVLLAGAGARAGSWMLPPALLLAWAPAVTLVAFAEEVALRALVQPAARQAWGPTPAILFAAAGFALLHLPLYGPGALPLDFGVGILIGALRERTGSVAACGLTHALADLGSWWLP